MSSTQVEIIVGGDDVTNRVLYSSASFESQQNAVPGTFEITIKDPQRTYTPPPTGAVVTLDLDGVRHFGGYLTQISRRFALPADELPTDSRLWVLRGADYNILFDKRVTRHPTDLKLNPARITGAHKDGYWIRNFADNYIDTPAGMDFNTYVDEVEWPFFMTAADATRKGAWKSPGTPWRDQIELIAQFSGAIWYIDPEMNLHFHAIENTLAPFGFSDTPDGVTTIGPRSVTATERGGPQMTNQAIVWGGSEWTEDVVVSRQTNEESVETHGLWQKAEIHFGEDGYKLQRGVDGRADLIVNGSEAALNGGFEGFQPGESFPQWDLSLTWFGENQPEGQQIRAGQLVTSSFSTFGGDLDPIVLPMRSVRINFVGVDETGKGHAQFTGSMGLAHTDPFSLWGYLRRLRRQQTPMVATATNATESAIYGAFGQFEPEQVSGAIYQLPNDFSYIAGTTQVYEDGILLARGTDYTETDPVAGTITFASAPTGDLWVVCRTA
jgi:hypothetical protein